MAQPLPWSYSSLEDFVNCPRAYHEKRILKSVKEEDNEHTIWGTTVHKHFELRQLHGTKLPPELSQFEPLMQRLDNIPGDLYAERKVALNRELAPCDFYAKDCWWRGVIDWTKINAAEGKARVYDYKTGKMHDKFKQLKLFALHTFYSYPEIEEVNVKFYWTKTDMATGEIYYRRDIKKLWTEFIPDLRQYVEAFTTDVWQPRQSGLCNGWCPVTTCEFWKPKRMRR